MPRRTQAHRVRDSASLAVETIFATHGWATEPILKDYGIDLLVQPCHGDEVEEFKLWVQVKGVLEMEAADAWQVTVKHACDWARSKEYVVFIVWNLNTGTGEFCLPRHQISDWALMQERTRTVRLRADGPLDSAALHKLQSIALLDHYQYRIVAQKLNWAWHPFGRQIPDEQPFVTAGRDVVRAACDLMIRLGMLAERAGRLTLDSEVVHLWTDTEPYVERLSGVVAPNLTLEGARLVLAVLQWIRRKTSVEPPVELAHTIVQAVNIMIENGFVDRLAGH